MDHHCETPPSLERHDCPVCASRRLRYSFSHQSHRVVRCSDCGLLFLNPQPSDDELGAIYNADYFLAAGAVANRGGDDGSRGDEVKRATARLSLAEIARYRGSRGGHLLEIGCGDGDFLVEAEAASFEVTGVEDSPAACENARRRVRGEIFCGDIEQQPLALAQFDLCILAGVIERIRDPQKFLRAIHRLLKPGGTIFLTTSSLDSWPARLLHQSWTEFKPEHLVYFDRRTIQTALLGSGFEHVIVQPGGKQLSLDSIARHASPLLAPFVQLLPHLLPAATQQRLGASGIMVFAHRATVPARQKVSVIMAAYNEAGSVNEIVDALLAKELPGLDLELIIVESNSTDGTRECVLPYAGHPRVQLILQDRPRGKGHAVRAGLAAATGEFILIQDADLEYDLEDYAALLAPLVEGREAFVLGSRHNGSVWKMRQFTGQTGLSALLNFGHFFFTTLVNVLFGLRLKDPVTMFKVFRRDCLHGLRFECDRFDFDYELLIKLVRKGYRPIEVPVNYRSRSFREGKKVSGLRDPFNWLRALVKLRFTRIDPLAEIERHHPIAPAIVAPAERVLAA